MARILIVDDEPINRELLHACLDGAGHELLDADSGESALAIVEAAGLPDLVLLDVMLPGLSGYDTAAKLKEMTRDEFVPIILVTALHDQAARLHGLRAGADEFLSKPVDRHELMLRIEHLLALRGKEAALSRRNVELAELHRFRDEMSQLIVHDLKNPVSVMLANIEYAIEDPGTSRDAQEALADSKIAGQRALRLLANLLDVAKFEAGRLQLQRTRAPLDSLVEPAIRQRQLVARSRSIAIENEIERGTEIHVDGELIGRVVENIFDNAIRNTPLGGRVAVRAQKRPTTNAVELRIGNTGAPIPIEARSRVFEKFGQAGGRVGRMNLGLGLYFCRLATEAHGGRIWIEETSELPTIFGLELPT